MTIRRLKAPGLDTASYPFSHVVTDGAYAFLSGVVAPDVPGGKETVGDVARETEVVMAAIREALTAAGTSMDRVVRVDVHMTDLTRMRELDPVYAAFFLDGALPARTCTEAGRLADGASLEITVMARL